jgi:SHS family lactate transporter-like MFS transporter
MATAAATRSAHWHAVTAAFLGWTLDAFDFFVVVFLMDHLAVAFGVHKSAIVATLGATLVMRPFGALLFGLLADRFGRRAPLMGNVIFYSFLALLCGFSQNYMMFLILRSLYGIAMGGEWGVGASLAMEAAPPRWRGVLSGIVQSGYSIGYLLAALAARFVLPNLGWRWMFWIGGVPALLALYIRMHVKESEAWKQHKQPSFVAVLKTAGQHWKLFLYLCVLMTLFMCLSHGTQDLYPDFLRHGVGLTETAANWVVVGMNVGAVLGAIMFGEISQSIGRRYAIVCALSLSLAMIPLWSFGFTLVKVAIGAFLIQVGVQGAWGIIPAHLNEIAPDAARGLVPGLAYQMGILFAAPTNSVEFYLRDHVGYRWALASFEITTMVLLGIVVLLGHEEKGKHFVAPTEL